MKDKKLLLEGCIEAIHHSKILVRLKNNLYSCHCLGNIRKTLLQTKNALMVGDRVLFSAISLEEGIIEEILPRQSMLSLGESFLGKPRHIAANIDSVLIVQGCKTPGIQLRLLDRYIIMSLKHKINPIIVINKIDYKDEEKEDIKEIGDIYKQANILVFCVSVKTEEGLSELGEAIKGKTVALVGESGVGKTSLFNYITKQNRPLGEICSKTGKGSHKTSSTFLMSLKKFKSVIIDSPGIKSFGVLKGIKPEELKLFFPEILTLSKECHYGSCLHDEEPFCAVREAVEKEEIFFKRFSSYKKLLKELHKVKKTSYKTSKKKLFSRSSFLL